MIAVRNTFSFVVASCILVVSARSADAQSKLPQPDPEPFEIGRDSITPVDPAY